MIKESSGKWDKSGLLFSLFLQNSKLKINVTFTVYNICNFHTFFSHDSSSYLNILLDYFSDIEVDCELSDEDLSLHLNNFK